MKTGSKIVIDSVTGISTQILTGSSKMTALRVKLRHVSDKSSIEQSGTKQPLISIRPGEKQKRRRRIDLLIDKIIGRDIIHQTNGKTAAYLKIMHKT